ncbi:MAG: phosphohistidine phosphatase SixA [Roseiflexaceae bacterium]
MRLYILRHGIAAERPADGSDHADRPLTTEGIRRMQAEVRGMQRLEVALEAIYASPYQRAAATAQIVAQAYRLTVEQTALLAPGGNWQRLIEQIEQRNHSNVLLVGHEPDLSEMISSLTGGSSLALKKGGLAMLELPTDQYEDGILRWLLPPKALIAAGMG